VEAGQVDSPRDKRATASVLVRYFKSTGVFWLVPSASTSAATRKACEREYDKLAAPADKQRLQSPSSPMKALSVGGKPRRDATDRPRAACPANAKTRPLSSASWMTSGAAEFAFETGRQNAPVRRGYDIASCARVAMIPEVLDRVNAAAAARAEVWRAGRGHEPSG